MFLEQCEVNRSQEEPWLDQNKDANFNKEQGKEYPRVKTVRMDLNFDEMKSKY